MYTSLSSRPFRCCKILRSRLGFKMNKWNSVLVSSDKPTITKLTSDVQAPTDGDVITLTCGTPISGVTKYVFKHGSTVVANQSANTYTIGHAMIGQDDGTYTCYAFINTVVSDVSSDLKVECE